MVSMGSLSSGRQPRDGPVVGATTISNSGSSSGSRAKRTRLNEAGGQLLCTRCCAGRHLSSVRFSEAATAAGRAGRSKMVDENRGGAHDARARRCRRW